MGNRLGRRRQEPRIQAFDFGDDEPVLIIPHNFPQPTYTLQNKLDKLNLKLHFKPDLDQYVILLIQICNKTNIPIDVGRYVILSFLREREFIFEHDFGEGVCLGSVKKERIDEEEKNSGWVLSSNNIHLSKFEDYVMFDEKNDGYNIKFSPYTQNVRKKIKNHPVIKNIRKEVDKYIQVHDRLSFYGRQGTPQNINEYINAIIILATRINDVKLLEIHPKLKMMDTDEIVVNISTKRDIKFFNFIHMTVTNEKLFMDEKWKTNLSEDQFISYETFEKVIDLIMYIKSAIGICKSIKFIMKPKNQNYIKFNVSVCLKICYSTLS